MAARADLEDRLAAWTDAGLLDTAQAERIRTFERTHHAASPTRDRVSGAIGTVGAVLVGLGILLLVAANWSDIGETAKVAVVVATMLVAHLLGAVLDHRGAPRWSGACAHAVGTLAFAGGIFLLGQQFNVRAHDPLGFLFAALGATAVTLLTGHRLLGWIAAAWWFVWILWEVGFLLEDVEDGSVALILLASILVGITGILVGRMVETQVPRLRDGSLLRDLPAVTGPLQGIALATVPLALLPLTMWWWIDDWTGVPALTTRVWFVVAGLVMVAIVAALADRHRRWTGAVGVAAALACTLALLVPETAFLVVLAYALFAAGAVTLLVTGLSEEDSASYGLGVYWVVLAVGGSYINLVEVSDIGGLGFVGAGLLLLVCAWLVQRSRMLWRERSDQA